MTRRKIGARFRQNLITAGCNILSHVFALPGVRGTRPQPELLKNLHHPRIVIIKPCCLGDVILSTPLLAALREVLPHSHLTYVVSTWARPAIEHNPHLNHVLDTGFAGSRFNRQSYFALVKKLRQGHYDLAIVLDRSPLLALLPWLAGIKKRAGLDSLGRGFALNYKAKIKPGQPRHEAEIYLDVLRQLGVEPNVPKLEFYPGDAAAQELEQKAAEWGLDLNAPYVVIHPGGGQNPDTTVLAKRWPAANFGEIALRLLQSGMSVVVIGTESDREAVNAMWTNLSRPAKLFEVNGQLDIFQTGALLQRACLFVGNDTGLMHLAASTNAAVVAMFGPSSPAMYGPHSPKGIAISPVTSDIPGGLPLTEYQALSVEQGGIARIKVDEVWEAINKALGYELKISAKMS